MVPNQPWLNEKFLDGVLNTCNNNLVITRSEIEPAVPLGENYFSIISRVKVYFKSHPDSDEELIIFITKSMPDGVMSDILRAIKTMEKEFKAYHTILPKIETLIGSSVAPKSYCSVHEDIIIMEDLRTKGYKMADRVKQLDYEHCVKALTVLAEFHAGSVILHESDPGLFAMIGEETVYPYSKTQKPFVENAFNLLAEEVENWTGMEDFAVKLRKAGENLVEQVGEAIRPNLSSLNVLNHGDFWGNNLLYNYSEDGKITDLRLIDWQMCRWTSPAMDLQMFFYSSVRDLESIDDLIRVYLSALNNKLSSLGSKLTMSEQQLKQDMQRTDCYGLLVSVSLLPICIGTRGKHLDFSDTTLDDFSSGFVRSNPYSHIYKQSRYKEIIPEILKSFAKKNIL